jgi:CubicO group peptidase (beta-lactamase class C family)
MKDRINILLTLLALNFYSCINSGQNISIRSRVKHIDIDSVIENIIHEKNIPAIVLGIFDTDSIITYTHGIRSNIDSIPVQKNDKFHIGSCSKSITSFVAARLIEKGIINWDLQIGDLLPEWRNSINPYYNDKSLADLLSHRAGIQPFTEGKEFVQVPDSIIKYHGLNERHLFSKWVLTQNPVINENNKYVYSNAGYTVAATMLEKASNESWENLVVEEFFNLFKISGGFGHPHLTDKDQPTGHINPSDFGIKGNLNSIIPLPDSLNYDERFLEPSGDISLSVYEYSIFLQEILKALLRKGSAISQENYNYMFFGYNDYSMGWSNPKENKIQYLSHDGSDMTFYCRVLICKEKNYGLVILANSGNESTVEGIYELSRLINSEIEY